MKKYTKLFFAAAAIFALASCQQDLNLPSPDDGKVLLTINTGAPQNDGTPQAGAPASRTRRM